MTQNPAVRSSTTGASFRVIRNGKQEIWNVAIADDKRALMKLRAEVGDDAQIEPFAELNAAQVTQCGLEPGEAKKE
jgi:hypothetical protein